MQYMLVIEMQLDTQNWAMHQGAIFCISNSHSSMQLDFPITVKVQWSFEEQHTVF